jgi:hypothetical protein
MSKQLFYRCGNEYGDPCEFALEGRKIPDTEVAPAMDGKPKCPGKTRSGKNCDSELVSIGIGTEGGDLPKGIWIGAGALAVLGLIAVFFWYFGFGSGGEPIIKVEPASLILTRSKAGASTASLQIANNGDGKLVIERIEAKPPVFSTSKDEIQVEPNDTATLFVHFKSPSAEKMEGELVLHSNAPDSPSTIKLTVKDPSWVLQELNKTSSNIKSTEP